MGAIQDISRILGRDVGEYIHGYVSFVENDIPNIVEYFRGKREYVAESFSRLEELLDTSRRLESEIIQRSGRMKGAEMWDLVETLGDIQTNLWLVKATDKFTKSNMSFDSAGSGAEMDVVMRAMITMEEMAKEHGYADSDNSWTRLAMRNDLDEESYGTDGGITMRVNASLSAGIVVDDIVDVMVGLNPMGKDIKRVITFEDNDLATVAGEECILQCYDSLLEIHRGDVPEFPDFGMNEPLGGSISNFAYPVVIKNYQRVFSSDATVESVSIVGFNNDSDIMMASLEIKSKFATYKKEEVIV